MVYELTACLPETELELLQEKKQQRLPVGTMGHILGR